MSEKKLKKRHRKKSLFSTYIINIIIFVLAALALTAVLLLSINKTAVDFVHKVESKFSVSVCDIKISDTYNQMSVDENPDPGELKYGEKFANITCENIGLNCDIYYGSNRVSRRSGAGFSADTAFFGNGKVSELGGYMQTYFSSLAYIEAGDVIKITSPYGDYSYKVSDFKYIPNGREAYKSDDVDMLVLRGVCSDFSQHSGECFYVFADRIEEGN